MTARSDSDRLTEVEMQLAHLQRQYDVLNEVVTEQSRQLDQAHKMIVKWEFEVDRLKNSVPSSGEIGDEKPPHY